MKIGLISGTGGYDWPGMEDARSRSVRNEYGEVTLTEGRISGVDVVHLCRHGKAHDRLSNHVDHRANVSALIEAGVDSVLSTTVCGAVDPDLPLGTLVVFDDLHFPSNRLPDGSLCTFFTQPGDPDRGHWVLHGGPFSHRARAALLTAAAAAGQPVRVGGIYGHVDGPRFNTPSEIAQLAACGVVAVSQTAGPETVLCGELELPYALVGFVTDHANEVVPGAPTPVATLAALVARSGAVLAEVLAGAAAALAGSAPAATGTMLRFGGA